MKNPEQLREDGLRKFCRIYGRWLRGAMQQLEEKIEKGAFEYFVKKRIYIGETLPMPSMEKLTITVTEKTAIRKIGEMVLVAALRNEGWSIEKEEAFGRRPKYYLVPFKGKEN